MIGDSEDMVAKLRTINRSVSRWFANNRIFQFLSVTVLSEKQICREKFVILLLRIAVET